MHFASVAYRKPRRQFERERERELERVGVRWEYGLWNEVGGGRGIVATCNPENIEYGKIQRAESGREPVPFRV